MNFYCARLLVICLVDDGKPKKKNTCDNPFFVIKAENYDSAFEQALQLGKDQETKYENHKGQLVKWVFVRVEQINLIGKSVVNKEVGSLLDVIHSKEPVQYSSRFNPKKHKPVYG